LAGNFGIFSPKNLNSLNSLWWNANSICYEVLMATGRLSEGMLAAKFGMQVLEPHATTQPVAGGQEISKNQR